MQKLYLYNTITRKKEEFRPLKDGKTGIYSCGPTVYNYAHIGNLRAYIFADILVRVLKYNYGNEKVKWVMNVTDVDDKTIRDSKLAYPGEDAKSSLSKFTCGFESHFWKDMKKLNVSSPDVVPHAASEKYIAEMQELVKNIFNRGFAYIKDGSAYFDVLKYSQTHKYGQLVNLDLSSLKSGLRIDADEYEKENIQDFVLWKGKKEGEPFWDFELNGEKLPGRPGWHIECSAMGKAELGMPFDIHTGGEDLRFPHHEDEIAQSVIGYEVEKPVNFWIHNGMLMVEGKKMSKSLGNFYNLRDIDNRGFNPLAFRFLCLLTHYRKPLDFSWKALEAAENGLKHLSNRLSELAGAETSDLRCVEFDEKFITAVNDDLNMPQALAVIQELLRSDFPDKIKKSSILKYDKVLGLDLKKAVNEKIEIPDDVKKLMLAREKAREEKDWKESDRLREEIEKGGYEVEDTKEGARIKKK